jgi:hypothetical protein
MRTPDFFVPEALDALDTLDGGTWEEIEDRHTHLVLNGLYYICIINF